LNVSWAFEVLQKLTINSSIFTFLLGGSWY
jgi:hypothetical protein